MDSRDDGRKPVTLVDDPLVARRIVVPTSRGPVVARPRLFQLLEAGAQYPLVTLVAPAGWGKTTLLSSWLRSTTNGERVAWLSVDREDNDAVRFWSDVIAAMTYTLDLPGDHALTTLRPTQATSKDDRFVAQMIDVIADLPEPVCLVLDDVHEIHEPSVNSALTYLASHVPPNLRIVLSGRFLADIPLGRTRVLNEVLEIDARSLAFTETELAQVLGAVEHGVSETDVRLLLERLEGWPAGARLAELSMAGATDPSTAISDLTGEESVVVEYFLNEVFDKQEPLIRDFLLLTCVTDSLNADLANALSGRADSELILETMATTNAFIGVQGRRPWYRYHQLLAQTLRFKLRRDRPDLVRTQHRAAARWYAAHGNAVDAVRHAVDGADLDTARRALSTVWLGLVLDGELTTLSRLMKVLPRDAVARDAHLILIRAVLELESGDGRAAQADAEIGEQLLGELDGPVRQESATLAAVVRLRLAQLSGDIHGARLAAETALAASRRELGDPLRAFALLSLGSCEYFTGQRSNAHTILRDGLRIARTTGHDYLVTGFLSQIAVVLTAQDRPVDAVRAAQEAVDLAERRGWGATPQMAVTWHALGWAHFLWNRLDEADTFLDRAELAAQSDDATLHASIHMVQGLVQSLRGNHDASLALLDAATDDLGDVLDRYVFKSYIHAETIRLHVALGQLEEAERRLDTHRTQTRSTSLAVAEAEFARAMGDRDAALRILTTAPDGASTGFLDQRLQATVLAAVLQSELGRPDEADLLLERALDAARPGNYQQPFLQLGAPARDLLERHRHCAQHATFVSDILGSGPGAGRREAAADGAELLSDREVEVLGHLADMLTAAEIGAEMFLSINTVKSHLKSIYRKLGVSSRRQAIARGTSLGLIPRTDRPR